jgi:hypothetical protein
MGLLPAQIEVGNTDSFKKWRRKLAERLYSAIPFFSYNQFYDGYKDFIKSRHLYDNKHNYLCYNIHRRRDFDLDTNILSVGAGRIGKSTDLFDMANTIYGFRDTPLADVFADKHIIWNAQQGFKAFSSFEADIIASDENYFLTDRRESMSFLSIKYLQVLNALASRRNIILGNIQEFTDIDTRILKKIDILQLIYERGSKLVFAKSHAFPITQQGILNTEIFEKKPYLLEDKERAIYELSKQPTYIGEFKFDDFKNKQPPIWSHYWGIKVKEQNKTIERINQILERLEEAKEELGTSKNVNIYDILKMG